MKLPAHLQNKWRDVARRLKIYERRRPDLQDVVEYVEEAAAVASDPVYGNQGQKSERNPASTRAAYATSTSSSCPICEKEGHGTLGCEKFTALHPEDRLQTAIRLKLCFVCLKEGHITRDCTSKMRCKTEDCGRMHATILHDANWSRLREQGRRRREQAAGSRSKEAPAEEPSATGSVYHAQGREDTPRDTSSTQGTKIALPLVPVRIYSPESKQSHTTYALLDTGSNVTLCHERLLRTLGIQGRAETMSLTTLDKKRNQTPTRVVSLEVTDPDGEGKLHLGQVYTRDSLPIDPRNRVTTNEAARWSHLKGLPLHHAPADEVMLLIGQDYPDALVPLATVPGGKGEPYAIKTRLGWTVNGPVSVSETRGEQQAFFTQGERYEQFDRQLENFWRLESSRRYDDDRAMSVQDRLVTARWERASVPAVGNIVSSVPALGNIVSSVPAVGNIVSSVPALGNIVSSVPALENIVSSVPAVGNIVSSASAVGKTVSSVPAAEKTVSSVPGEKKIVSSVPTVERSIEFSKSCGSSSDHPAVLEAIPLHDRSKKVKERSIDTPAEERALGVYWHMEEDYLGFKTQGMSEPLTKRGLLSMLSSIYDPLGLASPFILGARRIIQDLCRGKLAWDEKISASYGEQWTRWTDRLAEMEAVKIPRCILPPSPVKQQLHHFSDASEKAYGVVSYLRSQDRDGRTYSYIVMAKSRLAPLKTLTIPRLELQAATLATRQDALLRQELDVELESSQFWTDTTIVLQYIFNQERRFHTFVANRVAEIRGKSEVEQWHHVSTKDNPADDASRGVTAGSLGLSRW